MNGYEYDALDFAESCEYEIHNRQTTPSPMPWKYLEQTGFVVDANGEYIAQTWNKQEEDFPNAIANGNAIENLTAENAKLREQLAELASANGELKMQIVELKRMARAVNEWMVNNAD